MKKLILFIWLISWSIVQAQTFTVTGKIMEIKDTQTTPVAFAEAVLLIKIPLSKMRLRITTAVFPFLLRRAILLC